MIGAERPPSHDELTKLFAHVGLGAWDPGTSTGKLKRARTVLFRAVDEAPRRGGWLVGLMIESLQAAGAFDTCADAFVGTDAVRNAQTAFRTNGWSLSDDGQLRPLLLDGLDESQWSPALRLMINRARTGATDAALVTGTGKDLLEGAARQVLIDRNGSYDERMGFAGTMFQAEAMALIAAYIMGSA